jgi:hypothetical protein
MSSFVGDIFGVGGVGEAIKSISDDVGKLIPDATVREQVQAAIVAKQQELTKQANDLEQARVLAEADIQKAQIDVDKTQVTSADKFIAYARPAAIWVGVIGLLYASVISPLIGWFDTIFNWPGKILPLDTTITMQLLFGLLGLGGYRTIEKLKGVASASDPPKAIPAQSPKA